MRRKTFLRHMLGASTLPALSTLSASALGLIGVTTAARAEIGGLPPPAKHDDSSPEWDNLRGKLFQTRPLDSSQTAVQIIAPLRAAYGASVPVRIVSKLPQSSDRYVKRLYLVVDKNPSPIAAVLDLTTEVGQADFETRIRVDEYSHVRVVAELSDGSLHTDSRYVKTSGGCSAPPNRESPELIGRTILKVPEQVTLNQTTAADVTVLHPNDTGFELNQVTVMYIPAHFVRSIKVSYAGRRVFDADLDFSISENPTLRFNFVPHAHGELRAEVEDSKEAHWVGHVMV
jgi:sulfur-oxidizing protein SoxY